MADNDELIKRLLDMFAGELGEHASVLERGLLALEKGMGTEEITDAIKVLFRSAHSLKGAARAVNLESVEAVCHRMEEIFAGVRDGHLNLDSAEIQLLLRVVDGLKETSSRLKDKKTSPDAPLSGLLPELMAEPGTRTQARQVQAAGPSLRSSSFPAADPDELRTKPRPSLPTDSTLKQGHTTKPAELSVAGLLRISSDKLDTLIRYGGELRVASRNMGSMLESITSVRTALNPSTRAPGHPKQPHNENEIIDRAWTDLQVFEKSFAAGHRALEGTLATLHDELHELRLMPFSDACEGLHRMARDLARSTSKAIGLHIEGGDIVLDRAILERLKDPLRHLVRNAIDHGIENPDDRIAAGKVEQGRVTVKALLRGMAVEVIVEDDGRGLDFEAIGQYARTQNLERNSEADLADVIFLSGFSTAAEVSRISGRGIGLDAVKSIVESMRGAVAVETRAGAGSRFILSLPQTLSTIRGLLARCSGQTLAFDSSGVGRLIRIHPEQIKFAGGRQVLPTEDGPVPVASLAKLLGFPEADDAQPRKLALILLSYAKRRAFLTVDELLTEQEIVIEGLGPRFSRMRYVSGATVLADGTIAPIINTVDLLDRIYSTEPDLPLDIRTDKASASGRKRLIVVDDSATTRMLEKSILEAAGYDVRAAADGAEAWEMVQRHGADLVVSDVEMPNMDGFALTRAIRGSSQFRNLPVILVTALASEADKARGLEAGADAYIVKGAFDQRVLLETIEQFI